MTHRAVHPIVLLVLVLMLAGTPVAADSPQREKRPSGWTTEIENLPLDSMIERYQPYAKNISFYRPIYFLLGTDPEESKFQISFKYQLFNPEKPLVIKHPWVQGFHLAYTQTSFWDLASESAPFEDTSYKPELFFLSPNLGAKRSIVRGLFLKTGLQHESNGRGDQFSRSTNTAYIESILLFYNAESKIGARLAPRLWTYFSNDDETNPDLADYRGYFNLGIAVGKAEGLVVDGNFGWASEGPSARVDLTFPLHTIFSGHLDLYLQAQYVNSLAESLLDYTRRTRALRIGFAIVR
jgi:outer membrane phospholipase A